MTPEPKSAIQLEFSDKYDRGHSEHYFRKHHATLARRLSNWRDMQMARMALAKADNPGLVLDLPCGAGRFWPLLAENPNRVILAADNSADMLATAIQRQPADIVARINTFKTSAFDIQLQDNAVDSIFCMRLMHHIANSEHRLAMLREFHRVTRDTVILSLWVDGNFKAWRRQRLQKRRTAQQAENNNRFVVGKHLIEQEFRQTGFQILGHYDFLPGYAMWRVYVLRKSA